MMDDAGGYRPSEIGNSKSRSSFSASRPDADPRPGCRPRGLGRDVVIGDGERGGGTARRRLPAQASRWLVTVDQMAARCRGGRCRPLGSRPGGYPNCEQRARLGHRPYSSMAVAVPFFRFGRRLAFFSFFSFWAGRSCPRAGRSLHSAASRSVAGFQLGDARLLAGVSAQVMLAPSTPPRRSTSMAATSVNRAGTRARRPRRRNLAHAEGGIDPGVLAGDAHALERLQAGARPITLTPTFSVSPARKSGFRACGELRQLLVFDLLQQVHDAVPSLSNEVRSFLVLRPPPPQIGAAFAYSLGSALRQRGSL